MKNLILIRILCVVMLVSLSALYFHQAKAQLSMPFVGPNAANFNMFALIAHNYNRFGVSRPILHVSSDDLPDLQLYTHHPPLLSLVLAQTFQVFGESIYTARMVMVVLGILTLLMYFLTIREYGSWDVALLASVSLMSMPGFGVFSRMIGHEGMLLFFGLTYLWLIKRHITKPDQLLILPALLAVFMGVMVDWPMIYLVFFSGLIFYRKNRLNDWLIALFVAVLSGLLYFGYVAKLIDISQLYDAFLNRSLGALTTQSWWGLRWISLIGLRIGIYGGVFGVLGLGILSWYFQKRRGRFVLGDVELLIVMLLSFGIWHIVLYPEGSFGHPYWIFYLLPGLGLVAGKWLVRRPKKQLLLLVLVAFLYQVLLNDWKDRQAMSQLFRYDLAIKAAEGRTPYSVVQVHPGGIIDRDIWQYSTLLQPEEVMPDEVNGRYYVVSCFECEAHGAVRKLSQEYGYVAYESGGAKAYVFDLDSPPNTNSDGIEATSAATLTTITNDHPLRHFYVKLRQIIGADQL